MEITYQYTRDEAYWRTLIGHQIRRQYWFLRPSIHVPIALLLGLGGWFILRDINDPFISTVFFGAVVLALCLPLTTPKFLQFIALRRHKKDPAFQGEVTITLSDEGFHYLESHSKGTLSWEMFSGAVRYSDGILLWLSGAAVWLPDNALVESTANDATVLVGSKTVLRDQGIPG